MNIRNQRTSIVVACGLALCALPVALANPEGDKHFKIMDTNGDGKISAPNMPPPPRKMFNECDANHDGVVTAAEMDASMAAKGQKPAADDKSSAEKIKEIDQNNDGKLTTAEHEAGTEKMFARMDTNGDGFLSKEECDAGMKLMKKSQ